MRERERGREGHWKRGRGRERDIETLTEANISMDVSAYVCASMREKISKSTLRCHLYVQ